jgi:hypothetical protein
VPGIAQFLLIRGKHNSNGFLDAQPRPPKNRPNRMRRAIGRARTRTATPAKRYREAAGVTTSAISASARSSPARGASASATGLTASPPRRRRLLRLPAAGVIPSAATTTCLDYLQPNYVKLSRDFAVQLFRMLIGHYARSHPTPIWATEVVGCPAPPLLGRLQGCFEGFFWLLSCF